MCVMQVLACYTKTHLLAQTSPERAWKGVEAQVRLSRLGARGGQPHGSGASVAFGETPNPPWIRGLESACALMAEDKDGRITLADFQGFVGRMGGALRSFVH